MTFLAQNFDILATHTTLLIKPYNFMHNIDLSSRLKGIAEELFLFTKQCIVEILTC